MTSRTPPRLRPPVQLGFVLVVFVLLAFTAACGSTTAERSAGPSETDPAASVETGARAEGEDADGADEAVVPTNPNTGLSGEFATIDGSSIDLGPLAGQDVVLWFWAPW